MLIKNTDLEANEIPADDVTNFGSEKTQIQWLRKPEESKQFMLRKFTIKSQGHIGVHSHDNIEHQMYILKGPITIIDGNGNEKEVNEGNFVYCPPKEVHGYKNKNEYDITFICGIPKVE